MSGRVIEEWIAARERRAPCALVTVAATRGSVPRAAGAKMIVYASGETFGTIGGGKFEALVLEECRRALAAKTPVLKTYPLHEGDAESFGAICGGEVTVFIEPHQVGEAIFLVGAGHCSRAIAALARQCGLRVTVIDDRAAMLDGFECADAKIADPPPAFIAAHEWQPDEALVLASRNHEIDRHALAAALRKTGMGYLGMIGSRRKVARIFQELESEGIPRESLSRVFAPLGLDIGADSPAEIAVSVVAEILQVLRRREGGHLRLPVPP